MSAMNKKTVIATIFISVLLILPVGMQVVELVEANWGPDYFFSSPTVSPIEMDCYKVYPANANIEFSFNITMK